MKLIETNKVFLPKDDRRKRESRTNSRQPLLMWKRGRKWPWSLAEIRFPCLHLRNFVVETFIHVCSEGKAVATTIMTNFETGLKRLRRICATAPPSGRRKYLRKKMVFFRNTQETRQSMDNFHSFPTLNKNISRTSIRLWSPTYLLSYNWCWNTHYSSQ